MLQQDKNEKAFFTCNELLRVLKSIDGSIAGADRHSERKGR